MVYAGIRKSLAMRVDKVPSSTCRIVSDDVKFQAVAEIILEQKSCKQTATKYDVSL